MVEDTKATQPAALDIESLRKAEAEKVRGEEAKRLADLKATFPEGLGFAVAQYEKGAGVDQAKVAYCDVLRDRLKAEQEKSAKVEKDLASKGKPNGKLSGAAPVSHGEPADSSGGDALDLAKQLAAEKKITVTAALRQVYRENPDLYEKASLAKKFGYA